LSVQGIDARDVHGIGVAYFKDAILSSVGHVVRYTDTIEGILAVASRIGASRVANLECGDITTNKHIPLLDLVYSLVICAEMCGIHQCAHGISVQILPVGIQFTTKVLCVDVDVDLIYESDDLHIIRVVEHLNTGEGTVRN